MRNYETIERARDKAEAAQAAREAQVQAFSLRKTREHLDSLSGATRVTLSGSIGPSSAQRFLEQLPDSGHLVVLVDSDGGVVSSAQRIYERLAFHPSRVDVVVTGVAASAASYVAMAGETVSMVRGSTMMLHTPWTKSERDPVSDYLVDVAEATLLLAYSKRGLRLQKVRALMSAETWLCPEEAVDVGLADFTLESFR